MSTITIEPDTIYLRTKVVDGLTVQTEHVDKAYIERFLRAKSFFDSLSGHSETHTQEPDGTIRVESRCPEGIAHVTTFEPVTQ